MASGERRCGEAHGDEAIGDDENDADVWPSVCASQSVGVSPCVADESKATDDESKPKYVSRLICEAVNFSNNCCSFAR